MRRIFRHVGTLLRGDDSGPVANRLAALAAITLFFGFLYGGVMGTFGGVAADRWQQALISGAKVPLLLLATFLIAVPSFFVLNTLAGVRADFPDAVRALASGQAVFTVVLAALAPYTLLWYALSASYPAAVLFNGLAFAAASLAAQATMRRRYRPLVARDPRHRWLLRGWLLIYTFVAVQMAWTLRPFIGDPDSPVQFVRDESWSNAYVAVGRLVWRTLAH